MPVFLNLDDDRLLKVFRQVAGMPAPGEDMGGWYDLTGFSLVREMTSTDSSPATLWDSMFQDWPAPTRSPDPSRLAPRSTGWSRAMPKRSIPKPSFLSTIACRPTPMTSFPSD